MSQFIDRKAILEAMMDDVDIVLATIEAFSNSFQMLLDKVDKAVQEGNWPDFKRAVHALKGALSVFGDHEVMAKIRQVDGDATLGNYAKARDTFYEILPQLKIVYSELLQFSQDLHAAAA
jgi:hypothetical protein